jgi:hypothetical protein
VIYQWNKKMCKGMLMACWNARAKKKSRRPTDPLFPPKLIRASTNNIIMTHESPALPKPIIQQSSPLLTLPVELIQLISSYLDRISTASLCLSCRYTCFVIGRNELTEYITLSLPLSKFQRRKNIGILERAFPSHWYCSWCDTFHLHDVHGGPTRLKNEKARTCVEFNSYLHDEWRYVVCHHHVKLAVNRALWGQDYGIGIEAFTHYADSKRTSGDTVFDTRLQCEARVVEGRLILYASFDLFLPTAPHITRAGTDTDALVRSIIPIVPHVVAGHRNSHAPHTGFKQILEDAVTYGSHSKSGLCHVCATDFFVYYDPHGVEPRSVLNIQVWRDLGHGRNPFDASWRAHGELGEGREGFARDALRLTSFLPGDIKKAFESGKLTCVDGAPPSGKQRPNGRIFEETLRDSWTVGRPNAKLNAAEKDAGRT